MRLYFPVDLTGNLIMIAEISLGREFGDRWTSRSSTRRAMTWCAMDVKFRCILSYQEIYRVCVQSVLIYLTETSGQSECVR